MRKVAIYQGVRGEKGPPGLDGVDVGDVRVDLINYPAVDVFKPNRITANVGYNWSRTSYGTIVNRYGEVESFGSDTIDNILNYSQDFNQWEDVANAWTILSNTASDPLGGTNARTMRLDADNGQSMIGLSYGVLSSGSFTASFWIRERVGSVTEISIQKDGNQPVQVIPEEVTSTWKRVSTNFAEDSSGVFYINVRGNVGIEFDIFGAQINSGAALTDYLPTFGTPASQPNTEQIYRANQNGYLIESTKQNVSLNSEDLSASTWSLAGGALSQYSGKDVFGKVDQNIKITFQSSTITLTNDLGVIAGQSYTLSAFVKVESGTVDSLILSVGGGATESIEITDDFSLGFVRVSAQIVAGANQNITISAASGENAELLITGVQLEIDLLSSYIQTNEAATTRDDDVVSIDVDGKLLSPSDPFTILFDKFETQEYIGDRFIFHNNLTGNDEFYVKFNGDLMTIKNGSTEYTLTSTNDKFELVSDGQVLTVYSNAQQLDQFNITFSSSQTASSWNIGCDNTGSNQIESFLSLFRVYNTNLTIDELRFIRGSDSE
jgi:hypothetical protein